MKVNAIDTTDLTMLRKKLLQIEGRFSQFYFRQIFQLFSEKYRPEKRIGFKAYDGLNNILNYCHEMLSWKVHRALINAKLEPYLGFLHSIQCGKSSLVSDFQELYRYLIDDFVIQFCKNLKAKDFTVKTEDLSRSKQGKRQYLDDAEPRKLTNN